MNDDEMWVNEGGAKGFANGCLTWGYLNEYAAKKAREVIGNV
jgi:hypothetical protein